MTLTAMRSRRARWPSCVFSEVLPLFPRQPSCFLVDQVFFFLVDFLLRHGQKCVLPRLCPHRVFFPFLELDRTPVFMRTLSQPRRFHRARPGSLSHWPPAAVSGDEEAVPFLEEDPAQLRAAIFLSGLVNPFAARLARSSTSRFQSPSDAHFPTPSRRETLLFPSGGFSFKAPFRILLRWALFDPTVSFCGFLAVFFLKSSFWPRWSNFFLDPLLRVLHTRQAPLPCEFFHG